VSKVIDRPITLRSAIAFGLALAAEYSMLGLLEQYTVSLQIATMLCAIAGVGGAYI